MKYIEVNEPYGQLWWSRYNQPAFSSQLVAIFRPEPVIIQTLSLIREGLILVVKPPSRRVDNARLKIISAHEIDINKAVPVC